MICRLCGRRTAAPFQEALMAGWRHYQGFTQGGQPLTDTICPFCYSRPKDSKPTWNVECQNCDLTAVDEDPEPGYELDSYAEVLDWMDHHRCEPSFRIMDPKTGVWYWDLQFDSDGTLRRDKKA